MVFYKNDVKVHLLAWIQHDFYWMEKKWVLIIESVKMKIKIEQANYNVAAFVVEKI